MTRMLPAAALLAALLATPASAAAAPYDLNDDGRQELVVGLPWHAEGETRAVGAVAVVNGSRSDLLGTARLLTREDFGVAAAEHYAALGTALASGDFDGDGRADLAAGSPGAGERGAVSVRYGSSRTQTIAGRASANQQFSTFGSAIVAGDLDRDGYDDLVVGDPSADARPEADYGGGVLYVLYGSAAGLTETGSVKIDRSRPPMAAFGSVLALGDTNRDKRLDLFEAAQGQPDWSDDPPVDGHLTIGRNEGRGPVTAGRLKGEMSGGPVSLAIGDVNGDGYQDLVAGVPIDTFVGEDDRFPAGVVQIYPGGRNHTIGYPTVISQNSPGIPGSNQERDLFGSSVAVARIDGDRYADIVVGARGEDGGRGRVTIIRGGPSPRSYSKSGNHAFDQATRNVAGDRRKFGGFGDTLALLDLTGDGRRDLAVSAAGVEGGTVTVLRGVKGGFAAKGSKVFRPSRLAGSPGDDAYANPLQLGRVGSS